MLISVETLCDKFDVQPNGVLHVGAHNGEESVNYDKYGWGPVIWVEMLPEKYEALKARFAGNPGNTILNAACWDVDGIQLPLFRASNGESSSLLKPEDHLVSHPKITFVRQIGIETSRLDSILPLNAKFDYVSLDIQGAELRALRGLGGWLSTVKWACIEVNTRRLYEGCALLSELDAFMEERGFIRLITKMAGNKGWGDAVYVNSLLLPRDVLKKLRGKAILWQVVNSLLGAPKLLRMNSLLRRFR